MKKQSYLTVKADVGIPFISLQGHPEKTKRAWGGKASPLPFHFPPVPLPMEGSLAVVVDVGEHLQGYRATVGN